MISRRAIIVAAIRAQVLEDEIALSLRRRTAASGSNRRAHPFLLNAERIGWEAQRVLSAAAKALGVRGR